MVAARRDPGLSRFSQPISTNPWRPGECRYRSGMNLEALPVWGHVLIIALAGTFVWYSGTRLSTLADVIAERTTLSRALAGALLLGVATSLPEIATTVTASVLGNAPLAVNNLMGGVAMQIALIALIDCWLIKGALTFFSPRPVLLLGGVLLMLQSGLTMTAMAAGDVAIFGSIGLWPILLVATYLMSLFFMHHYEGKDAWIPAEVPEAPTTDDASQTSWADHSLAGIWLRFALHGGVVLFAGWAVSAAADAFAQATAISSSLIGATLVAATTSLPEVSTTAGAVRRGAYTMVIANIFGTNSLEMALLFIADLGYRDGPIVNAVDRSAIVMGGVAVVMTSIYLWGLLERRDQTIWRLGVDSFWVLITYLGGLIVMGLVSSAEAPSAKTSSRLGHPDHPVRSEASDIRQPANLRRIATTAPAVESRGALKETAASNRFSLQSPTPTDMEYVASPADLRTAAALVLARIPITAGGASLSRAGCGDLRGGGRSIRAHRGA